MIDVAAHADHVTVVGLTPEQGNAIVGAMIRACQREYRRFGVEECVRVARTILTISELPVRGAGGAP